MKEARLHVWPWPRIELLMRATFKDIYRADSITVTLGKRVRTFGIYRGSYLRGTNPEGPER